MASNFIRKILPKVGVTAVQFPDAVATKTEVTVIGLSLANIISTAVKASVFLRYKSGAGTADVYLIKNMDVIPGQTQVLVGGDQKLVLLPGDTIWVTSNTAASLDCIMSMLVISY